MGKPSEKLAEKLDYYQRMDKLWALVAIYPSGRKRTIGKIVSKEKASEIVRRYNAHNDLQAEIAKLKADIEYYEGVADGYEQILQKRKE